MSTGQNIDQFFEAALVLTPAERVRLADKLYQSAEESLDPEDVAYLKMLDDRDAAAERGETKSCSLEDLRKRIFPEESR